jgi:hypothetical protein
MIAAALRALPVMAALASGIGGGVPVGGAAHPHWTEVGWPFPIDQWGGGRAYRCEANACGITVNLYLRPKIGFCNCAKGVYDDGELDRVSDITLIGPQYAPLDQSRAVSVGWMPGRSRAFTVSGPYQVSGSAAVIAFNNNCDVVVATVTADGDLARGARAALQFLNTEPVLAWARRELGSGGS